MAFKHKHHPHTENRKNQGPIKAVDQHKTVGLLNKINAWLAVKITAGVGTMWCAYLFAILALISLPAAIKSGQLIILIAWIAQTFLQLVLLSIIIVGQNIQSTASDKRAEQTFLDAEAILHEAREIQNHLLDQDKHLLKQDSTLEHLIDRFKDLIENTENKK